MNEVISRHILTAAFASLGVDSPTRACLQVFQAVARHETGEGTAWKGAGAGSHNWGALQGKSDAGYFVTTDTHPNADGTSTTYQTNFRKYSSDIAGATDLVRLLIKDGVVDAADSGNATAVATRMHDARYFEGNGSTVEQRIAGYALAIFRNATAIASALGEPLCVSLDEPTLFPSLP